ncbi:Arc family DNA-binding protein [Rhodopseudomonas palustris]|uniref:Arc family DNA-binding protein n=2 Tax=Rhodopseudomonas palustris TaxID=1076 RepID=A0A418V1C4_RHOPL|nr:Arc family DNA-binding protein [Rhodopseudomonas palustris]RJF69609.1 Arc family DNA-binding protein [Rhodopseudomonas palustris]
MAKKAAKTTKAGRGSDQFVLRMPPGMRDMLAKLADQNGRSMNSQIVMALAIHIAQWPVKPEDVETFPQLEATLARMQEDLAKLVEAAGRIREKQRKPLSRPQ